MGRIRIEKGAEAIHTRTHLVNAWGIMAMGAADYDTMEERGKGQGGRSTAKSDLSDNYCGHGFRVQERF
jgi:hypothetical protein